MTPESGRYCTSCYTGHYPVAFPRDQQAYLQLALKLDGRPAQVAEAEPVGMSGGTDYRSAGVDIDAGNETVRRIKSIARATFTPGVLSEIGSFGGLFSLADGGWTDPVLVSSADGVGTKLKVAFMAGVHDTIGRDLVNHCVNDILVQGATPLFFLDYLATGRLSPDVAEQIVTGLAAACRDNGCALLGGETAEMPGFYADGEYDVAGFIVGAVERSRLVDGRGLVPGDVLIGLPSTGLHTNGYSLARRIVFDRLGLTVDSRVPELGETVGAALLRTAPLVPGRDAAAARGRAGQGHGAHHRRRHHRQPAADPAARALPRKCGVTRGPCPRSSRGWRRPAGCRSTTSTAPSTWASGWWSRSRRPTPRAP